MKHSYPPFVLSLPLILGVSLLMNLVTEFHGRQERRPKTSFNIWLHRDTGNQPSWDALSFNLNNGRSGLFLKMGPRPVLVREIQFAVSLPLKIAKGVILGMVGAKRLGVGHLAFSGYPSSQEAHESQLQRKWPSLVHHRVVHTSAVYFSLNLVQYKMFLWIPHMVTTSRPLFAESSPSPS